MVNISNGEKLILVMLCDIYERLGIEGDVEPEFIKSAIYRNHAWAIPWAYSGIPFDHEPVPPIVKEVVDILSMWSFIEYSYQGLDEFEKTRLAEDAGVFGRDLSFRGFDGNNESEHMSVASFLINDLDRFDEFKGRSMNSNMPLLDAYRRMLPIFEAGQHNLLTGRLDLSALTELLREMIHPDQRQIVT